MPRLKILVKRSRANPVRLLRGFLPGSLKSSRTMTQVVANHLNEELEETAKQVHIAAHSQDRSLVAAMKMQSTISYHYTTRKMRIGGWETTLEWDLAEIRLLSHRAIIRLNHCSMDYKQKRYMYGLFELFRGLVPSLELLSCFFVLVICYGTIWQET